MSGKTSWIQPKPVYAAAGLLILVGGLLFTVVASLENGADKKIGSQVNQIVVSTVEQPSSQVQTEAPVTDSAGSKSLPSVTVAAPVAVKDRICWPLQGKIQREMGWQLHPVFLDWRYHVGIDIQAGADQPVQAMLSGTVSAIYTDNNSGLTVVVKSDNYTVYYGSLAAAAVEPNSQVTVGSRIGTAGLCGAEPYLHLHLAVKSGDQWIDPRELTNK